MCVGCIKPSSHFPFTSLSQSLQTFDLSYFIKFLFFCMFSTIISFFLCPDFFAFRCFFLSASCFDVLFYIIPTQSFIYYQVCITIHLTKQIHSLNNPSLIPLSLCCCCFILFACLFNLLCHVLLFVCLSVCLFHFFIMHCIVRRIFNFAFKCYILPFLNKFCWLYIR